MLHNKCLHYNLIKLKTNNKLKMNHIQGHIQEDLQKVQDNKILKDKWQKFIIDQKVKTKINKIKQ